MFVRGTVRPREAGCLGSPSAERVSLHAPQRDCGTDGSRSPAAAAQTLRRERQVSGETGSPSSKGTTKPTALGSVRQSKRCGSDTRVNHTETARGKVTLVLCWWKSLQLLVSRMEVTGSACRKLLPRE